MIARSPSSPPRHRILHGAAGEPMRLYDEDGRLRRFSSGSVLSLACLPPGRYELRQGPDRQRIRLDASGTVAVVVPVSSAAVAGGRD